MILPDVNVLIYAHRPDTPHHRAYADWLERTVTSPEPFALSELVLAGFLRLVTNNRAFRNPSPADVAMAFVDELLKRPSCRLVGPGPRHFRVFQDLFRTLRPTGAFVADVYHAALAIEHGCIWVTNDADFARIPGLRWRHPLAP
jgi:toxin-antitoxin system PIN domain toxin